jgi:hypothetical protein
VKNDGGPAFPQLHESYGNGGMSLRDYFAGQVVSHIMGRFRIEEMAGAGVSVETILANLAYKQADAMLAERAKRTP